MKHVVLAFHGHFERDNSWTYAHGDDAPVFVHGVNDDEALDTFKRGVMLWISVLAEDGNLDRAVKEGLGEVKLSTKARSGEVATVKRDADRFEIELAGVN